MLNPHTLSPVPLPKQEKPIARVSEEGLRLHEKVKALYQYSPLVLISNLMITCLLLVVLWHHPIRDMGLVPWALCLLAIVFLRACLFAAYNQLKPKVEQAAVWGWFSTVGSLLAGCLWGAAAVFLWEHTSFDYQLLGLFVLGATGAGAVSLLTPYLPAFYAYFFSSFIPFVFVLVVQGTIHALGLDVMMVLYVVALTTFARKIHLNFVASINLRYENSKLVEELTWQKEEAERSNIAKSRFLAAASHDLRQPMHALGLFVGTLKERILYPDLRKIVDNIGASVEAMNDLFNALLDISKLDAGVIRPQMSDFCIKSLLERIYTEFESQAREKGLSLRIYVREAIVHSDPALLERILRNFVTNAVRYTKQGGILMGVRPSQNGWRVEVWDTGLGIPDAKLKDIFQEFVQLDNPERDRSKGLGLGLAIVDRLARLMHHDIFVKSFPRHGSVFGICLPEGILEPNEELLVAEPAPSYSSFANRLIVVVDDEAAILEAMKGLLEGWGCEVLTAGSGDDMQTKLAECTRIPDLIVSDYRLRQGETGVEVIQRLQQEFNENIPGILVTGDTAPNRIQEARASGFELLHKPLQPAKLRALINHVLLMNSQR